MRKDVGNAESTWMWLHAIRATAGRRRYFVPVMAAAEVGSNRGRRWQNGWWGDALAGIKPADRAKALPRSARAAWGAGACAA
jgi:hypothetical protein